MADRPKCLNCGRVLVPGRSSRTWLHRLEDFAPDRPIDCYYPAPDLDQLAAQPMDEHQTIQEFVVHNMTVLAGKPGERAYLGYLEDGRPVIIRAVDRG